MNTSHLPSRELGSRALLAFAAVAAALLLTGRAAAYTPPPPVPIVNTDTTITFDDQPSRTEIVGQYHDQGVDFLSTDALGGASYVGCCIPMVTASSGAHSGGNVASLWETCGHEICTPGIFGVFKDFHSHVSVVAGLLSAGSTTLTLTAYDANRTPIGHASATVSAGPVNTPLRFDSNSTNIAAFSLVASDDNRDVAIDDLSFDPVSTQPVPPAPDFALGYHSASPRLPVSTATPKTVEITISRFNGSTGAIAFSVADPGGWKVSFSPTTPTATSVTMTVATPDEAQAGDTRDLVVTATPTTPAAGSTPRQVTIPVAAVAAFVLRDIGTEQLDTCTRSFALPVDRDFDFADPINLSVVDPGPYGASISPATITRPAQQPYTADATITISPPPNAPDSGTITVRGTSGAATFTRTIPVKILRPTVAGVPPTGSPPQFLQGGTTLLIDGTNFCPSLQVQFGNKDAVATPTSVSHDGTKLYVQVPRLATDGPITIGGASSPTSFRVQSFRNRDGFAFQNYGGHGLGFEDMSDLYGYDQTHLKVDPCSWVTLGFADCSLVTLPIADPGALIYFDAINSKLKDGKGRCFGMTLASLRFAAGDRKLSDFAPAGALGAFDLTGAGGPTGDLDHYIHLMFVEQNSLEGLLARAAAQRTPMTADALRAAVESTLRTNRGALLSLHQGDSGHSVIAYDVENDPDGGYFLDVYDPNRPFLASENSDADQHEQRVEDSRIAVDPAGGGKWKWSFKLDDENTWSGLLPDSPMTLMVLPYSAFPLQPTLPGSIAQGIALLFDGNADVQSVKDSTGESATYLPSESGDGSDGAYLLDPTRTYTETVRGTGSGTYGESFVAKGFAARIDGVDAGGRDRVTLDPRQHSLTFASGAAQKPVTVELLARGSDGAERTVTLRTTSFAGGSDTVAFDGRSASFHHAGPPTTATVQLSTVGTRTAPADFVAQPLAVASGQTAVVAPDWRRLATSGVALTVGRKHMLLHDRARPPALVSLRRLSARQQAGGVLLSVRSVLAGRMPAASAVVVWRVSAGRRLVASHAVTVPAGKLRRGARVDSWRWTPTRRGRLTFAASVTVVAPAAGSLASVTQSRSMGFAA